MVRGRLLPSRLWLIIGYTITIDDKEQFSTAQAASTEDFRWQFSHHGQLIEGHFETFGNQNATRRMYRLTIDGDELGPNEVRLRGTLPFFLGVITLAGLIAIKSLRFLTG